MTNIRNNIFRNLCLIRNALLPLFLTLAFYSTTLQAIPDPAPAVSVDVNISEESDWYNLSNHFEYLADPESEIDIKDLLDEGGHFQWRQPTGIKPSLGFNAPPYWFHAKINNLSQTENRWIMSSTYSMTDELDVYVIKSEELVNHYQSGDLRPLSKHFLKNNEPLFPLDLAKGESVDVYFYVNTEGSVNLPVDLSPERVYFEMNLQFKMFDGIFFGGAIVMLLYNLGVYFGTREKSLLNLILFISASVVATGQINGYGSMFFWPETPEVNIYLTNFSLAVLVLSGVALTNDMLVAASSERLFQLTYKAFRFIGWGIVVGNLIIPYRVITPLAIGVLIVALVFISSWLIYLNVRNSVKGISDDQLKYYSFSLLIFVLSAIFWLAENFGLVPLSTNINTNLVLQLGWLGMLTCLSFCYADKLNQDKEKKDAAYKELLAAKQQVYKAEIENHTKSDFLAKMSHEIRTPMNGVLGMSELLREHLKDPVAKQYNELIYSSGSALLTIINDILDYSKMESGKMELESVPFDLAKLCVEALSIFQVEANAHSLQIICDIEPEMPLLRIGDPTRVRQIILNLVGNAFKFTEQGEVVLRIKAPHGSGDVLHFSVEDSGVGIPDSAMKKLFESFGQADVSTSRKYGGTGLGLTISKQLVTLMGGKIGVESTEGLGSTFWFTAGLPVYVGTELPVQEKVKDLKGFRIAFVDDNKTYREIVEAQLRSWGVEVQTFSGGKALLETLSRNVQWDLIISDLDMPHMNGLQLAKKLRDDKRLKDLPFMLVSATSVLPVESKLLDCAILMAAEKPIVSSDLQYCIREALGLATKARTSVVETCEYEKAEKMNILIAEDNKVNQVVIKGMLKKLGHDITVVNNGQEVIDCYKREQIMGGSENLFQMILMDCEMPEVDGFSATKRIRELEKLYNADAVPIIALTAHAIREYLDRCIESGMNDYLTKPLSIDKLYQKFENISDSKRSKIQ